MDDTQIEMLPMLGEFSSIASQYEHIMFYYESGIQQIVAKLQILNNEFKNNHERNPIENIKSRVKSLYYVRRVVAVPGDTVQIKDGALYVNDELYKESTDVASMEDAGLASDPIELEKDEYFVLGDNRNNSEDSRYANIGNVKRDYIIGKAWFRFSGLGSFGTIK